MNQQCNIHHRVWSDWTHHHEVQLTKQQVTNTNPSTQKVETAPVTGPLYFKNGTFKIRTIFTKYYQGVQ